MKRTFISVGILTAILAFTLSGDDNFVSDTFFSMGTIVQITIRDKDGAYLRDVRRAVDQLSFEITNDLYRLNNSSGWREVTQTTYQLLQRGAVYKGMNPRFDIKSATVSSLYGFPQGPFIMPDENELSAAMEVMHENDVYLKEEDGKFYASTIGLSLDMGAYAKGFIVDHVVDMLQSAGAKNFIINGGGDIYADGTKSGKKWTMGITNPDNKNSYLDIVNVENKALATSGNYERFFINESGEKINHIFDGVTGEPVDSYRSISILAANAESADAIATVYYLLTLEEIEKTCINDNVSVLVLTKENELKKLCGWEKYSVKH